MRTKSIDDVARDLAQAHRNADPKTSIVKHFSGGPPIKLLEVSADAPTTGEILPFGFAADMANGVDYPSVIILVSPEEWVHVESGSLALPSGWDLQSARDL